MVGEWWKQQTLLASFCRWLVRTHRFSGEELLSVVEKPWAWTEEFENFLARKDSQDVGARPTVE